MLTVIELLDDHEVASKAIMRLISKNSIEDNNATYIIIFDAISWSLSLRSEDCTTAPTCPHQLTDNQQPINPNYSSSLRSEGCIYNKISDKTIEAYPLIW